MRILLIDSIKDFVLLKLLRIAGTPLEPYKLQHRNERYSSVNV